MIAKHMKDVAQGDVLAEDIIHENVLLIKKGTELSKRMIDLLKKREIESIKIALVESQPELVPNHEHIPKVKTPIASKDYEDKERDIFFHLLSLVGNEHRYGKIFNQDKDIQLLIQLFTDMHGDHELIDKLYALRDWDHYAFIHSFDVFVLGTLLAKKHGIEDLNTVALGYLFHDIGKMEIPQDISNKKGKLTFNEFELIKKHTMRGEAILHALGQDQIAFFARSHHERVDGSGYPDKLSGKKLSAELNVLQIVDVYSALTLKRAYKEAMSAQEALQILMQDVHKYNKDILYDFIDALAIYPTQSVVLLSDDTTATINEVNKYTPILPHIKRSDNEQAVTLPYDFSLTISKMIHFESKSFQFRLSTFLNDLIIGDKQKCADEFVNLIDGLQLEDIYMKVILPTYWEGLHLLEENLLTNIEYNRSHTILLDLLEQIEREMKELNFYKFKTVVVIERDPAYTVPLNIALGLLHVENIFPVVFNIPFSNADLEEYMINNHVEGACIIHSGARPKQDFKSLKSKKIYLSKVSYRKLEQIFTDISQITGRSINFYEHLFN